MKSKLVVKVALNDEKSRSKALRTACGFPGLSLCSRCPDKSQVEVVGDGIDAAGLVSTLRKKVGHAELMSVSPIVVEEKQGNIKKTGSGCLKGEGDDKSPTEVKSDGIYADIRKKIFDEYVPELVLPWPLFDWSYNQPKCEFGEKQVRPPEDTLRFESVSLEGDDKRAIEITGDGNDAHPRKRREWQARASRASEQNRREERGKVNCERLGTSQST
ncbi:uncharacterized protein LOC110423719 isoform X2 [Herrania umbratica]|uniref:Uncharacterized protein LOC110423719 isoform X2 n=1 Tax=Herrania umbratica TaxID=108875 RepID=A0A6J1B3B8_9ROSI|nr:uncharacterized protein LOC110423719 isoform X2 [Herrania umbratica]